MEIISQFSTSITRITMRSSESIVEVVSSKHEMLEAKVVKDEERTSQFSRREEKKIPT